MAWIRTFEENEARGLLTWVYKVARWTQGRIPNIVKSQPARSSCAGSPLSHAYGGSVAVELRAAQNGGNRRL